MILMFLQVHEHVVADGGQNLTLNLVASILAEADTLQRNDKERDAVIILSRLLGVG